MPKVYPVIVPNESPVLRGLTLSKENELEGRDPRLPTLYDFEGDHPPHRIKFKESRTFAYLIDPSPKGKSIALALWLSLKISGGSASGLFITRSYWMILHAELISTRRYSRTD